MLTPEQETVLQSFLMRKTQEWQQYCKEYPELLKWASYHITPDGCWVSVEHEQMQKASDRLLDDGTPTGQIIRKSPACTTIVTKL